MDELLIFRRNALLNNLCKEWDNKWGACHNDKEQLVRLVMMQQSLPYFLTYCYNGKGLSKEYIQKEFAQYINGNYTGIDVDGVQGNYTTQLYVGENSVLNASNDVSCFMWATIPSLEINACKATKMYVGCDSHINLVCNGYNSVTVMLFDDSMITIDDADDESKIIVYKYSDKAKVNIGKYCLCDVRIFNKELKL